MNFFYFLSFNGVSLEYWRADTVCPPSTKFCRRERKKDLGRLFALQLWLLFPFRKSVPKGKRSQDSHQSFLRVPSEVCEETTTGSCKLPLHWWPQGVVDSLPSVYLAFMDNSSFSYCFSLCLFHGNNCLRSVLSCKCLFLVFRLVALCLQRLTGSSKVMNWQFF